MSFFYVADDMSRDPVLWRVCGLKLLLLALLGGVAQSPRSNTIDVRAYQKSCRKHAMNMCTPFPDPRRLACSVLTSYLFCINVDDCVCRRIQHGIDDSQAFAFSHGYTEKGVLNPQ